MLLKIKKTGDKTFRVDGNPYFIAGLVCFIITFLLGLFGTKGLDKAFLYATGLTIVVTPIAYVLDQADKRKHKKVLSSKLFQQLLGAGFEVEEQKDYKGLIGERNQTAFRIYYDWTKLTNGFLSFGDIAIIAYYEPLVTDFEKGIVNEDILNSLNQNYKISIWKSERTFSQFAPAFFIRHLNYYPFTKTDSVIVELEKISALIKANGLTPVDKNTLLVRQKEFGYNYAPPIETFEME